MQRENSYYGPLSKDDEVLRAWLRSEQMTKTPTRSSDVYSVDESEDIYSPALEIALDDAAYAASSDWASSTTQGDPFGSQNAMSFESDTVELPEIPFIASLSFSSIEEEDEEEEEEGAWPTLMQRTPSSSSSDRQLAVLGQTPQRILSHSRQRSGSISSTASRPAPAKSILSSSSSIKTRKGRSTPSVKFLDVPVVHYADEDDLHDDIPQLWSSDRLTRPVFARTVPDTPPVASGKKRVFSLLTWFTSSSKWKTKTTSEKPSISGPFPLWDAPRRSESIRRCGSPTSGKSMRSVRSTSSLRSTRSMRSIKSCTSRMQGYWGRLSGKDP